MPFYLFTFRPQVSDQHLFEDFLSIFLPILDTLSKYSYSIEEDGTLNKHIHVLVEHKAKDNNAWKQLFKRKIFKDFKESLTSKMTNEHGFDDRMVKEDPEDLLKVLGYVNKETDCIRRKYKGFTNEEVLSGIKFYYASEHIDKSKVKNDWTVLTTKNAHVIIEKFVEDNEMDWNEFMIEQTIKIKMIESKFSFINFTKEKQSQLFNELIIANTKTAEGDFHRIAEQHIYDITNDDKESQLLKRICFLEKLLSDNEISYN
jgi:hypothetical protein